jgi:hypothetical protein
VTNLLQAVNFGGNVETNFARLRELQPTGPRFCSEFYPGWFDGWGSPHHLGDPASHSFDGTPALSDFSPARRRYAIRSS